MTDPISRADILTARLAEIEREAQEAATALLASQVAALTVKATAATLMSTDSFQYVLRRLEATFRLAPDRAQRAVEAGVRAAFQAGLEDAAGGLQLSPLDLDAPVGDVDVTALVLDQLIAARAVLRSNEDIPVALGLARRAVTRVEAATAWHVHRAAADATERTARHLGLERRWIAERDACLHCLAYQGETAIGAFAGGLTFGDKPLSTDPVPNPPLHPHCRCITQVHDPADTMVIDALKREAARSVLRGTSLPSESEKVRLRAADRLLRNGVQLPKTVQERARKAVKRGSF